MEGGGICCPWGEATSFEGRLMEKTNGSRITKRYEATYIDGISKF